jgi:hypothetical protein
MAQALRSREPLGRREVQASSPRIQRCGSPADIGLMAKKTAKGPRVYRDASTGRFVTKKYARKHPKTTVKGRGRVPATTDDSTG